MGFWSREIDVAGLTSVPLIDANRVNVQGEEPYSIADKKARANITAKYGNDMEAYRMGYIVGFRREYRKSFSEESLYSKGFLPAVAEMKKLNEAAMLAWLAPITTPPATSILSTATGRQTPYSSTRVYMQNVYGPSWSNSNNMLTNGDINGFVGDWLLVSAVDGGGEFTNSTFDSLSGHPQQVIHVTYSVPPPDNATMIQYQSSSVPGDWYMFVAPVENVPDDVYDIEFISVSPIITVKSDNQMADNETDVIMAMDDLGINGQDMWDELIESCPEGYEPPPEHPDQDCDDSVKIPSTIDNAYILTGVAPDTDDSGVYGSLFEWFNTFATVNGTFALSMNEMYMNYTFNVSKSVHTGQVTSEGKYTKTITSNPVTHDIGLTSEEMTIQWQKTLTTYEEIKVTNFNQEWAVIVDGDHWKFNSGLSWDGDSGEKNDKAQARLVLTLDMYNLMDYDLWVPAHETGMCLVAFSVETIKLKWWQTGIFKIVVIAIVTYLSWGSASTFAANLVNAVVDMAIAMVIGMIAQKIAMSLDSEFLQILVLFVAAVAMSISGNFDASMFNNFEGYLKLATHAIEAYNKVENMQAAATLLEDKEEMDKLMAENEELEEMVKAQENTGGNPFNMNIIAAPNGAMLSPEEYFSQKYGDQLYDFDSLFDVDAAYDMRKNVKT